MWLRDQLELACHAPLLQSERPTDGLRAVVFIDLGTE